MSTVDASSWESLAPHFAALLAEPVGGGEAVGWLRRWSDLQLLVYEARAHMKRARLRDFTDRAAADAFARFGEQVMVPFAQANQQLSAKLLALPDYQPAAAQREMLRRMRAEAALYHPDNPAIEAEIERLALQYDALLGAMRVELDGRQITSPELEALLADPDQQVRRAAWEAAAAPWRDARPAIDALFLHIVQLRAQLARNAGLPDYRAYRWLQMARFDYTPGDALIFDEAVASSVIPLAGRLIDRRRTALQIPALRPWDLAVQPAAAPARLFPEVDSFIDAMGKVLARTDDELGQLFQRMRDGYLDLGWRQGKPAGGEEWLFPLAGLPCIRLDRDGTLAAAMLLLHEMGHAFHDYLALNQQRLYWNLGGPTEFEEFAAISLTYLAAPQLLHSAGGFLSAAQLAQEQRSSLAETLCKWLPSIAQTDAFQHWLYTTPPDQLSIGAIDAQWRELGARYTPWVAWGGLPEEASGWQRSRLLFSQPFYMLEYGVAHFGAWQLWRSSLEDPQAAWENYRAALGLGNSRSLKRLFAVAGARLPFVPGVVEELVAWIEERLGE